MGTESNLDEFKAKLCKFIHIGSSNHPWDKSVSFQSLALELFSFQFESNLAYRTFCQARGASPATVSHWSEIPAVPASAFKELELTSLPHSERTRVFYSSGTTGQSPSRHFHNSQSLVLYETSLLAWFSKSVLPLRRLADDKWRLAIMTPPPTQAPNSSLVHMFATVAQAWPKQNPAFLAKTGPDGGWTLDSSATVLFLQDSISLNRPVLLLGAAFCFVHLLDYLLAENIRLRLPAGSLALETGGYKGRSRVLSGPELHELITAWLDIDRPYIIREYGMSELCSQASDVRGEWTFTDDEATNEPASTLAAHPHQPNLPNRDFCFPPWARAQIISPENGHEVGEGETGLIRVFDLANAYSVMAIQTEDLGVRRANGFNLVGRAPVAEPRGCSLMVAS